MIKRDNNYIDIILKGTADNKNAIGAKVLLFSGNKSERYEKFPVRGFLSSMEVPLQIGMKDQRLIPLSLCGLIILTKN